MIRNVKYKNLRENMYIYIYIYIYIKFQELYLENKLAASKSEI